MRKNKKTVTIHKCRECIHSVESDKHKDYSGRPIMCTCANSKWMHLLDVDSCEQFKAR